MIKQIALGLSLGLSAFSMPVQAATFVAEFWDVDPVQRADTNTGSFSSPFNFQTDVLDVVATPADLIFTVAVLDFPNETLLPTADTLTTVGSNQDAFGNRTETARLSEFLGSEAGGVDSDDTSPLFVAGSIFRFSGLIEVSQGVNVFEVQSDDGFQLSLDGAVQPDSATGPRSFASTVINYTSASDDIIDFELIYYDSGVTQAGLFVTKDGDLLIPTAIPLPAGGVLLLSGLLGAGLFARRKTRA
ncbi:MAG: VPLPA-CTERM sorting domain-containing protein [Pseudomonadota bacterium]